MTEKTSMTTSPPGSSQLNLWITHPKDGNPLRLFLAWRKRCRTQGTFAYANHDTTLHRELSIVDNFMLAMGEPPMELPEHEKETFVRKCLEKQGLLVLTRWFALQTSSPTNMTIKERSMASICCALLAQADETLIDLSGMALDEMALKQTHSTLVQFNRTIIIATTDETHWNKSQFNLFNPNQAFVQIKKSA